MKSTPIVCTFPSIRPICTVTGLTTRVNGWLAGIVRIPSTKESKTILVVAFCEKVDGIDYVERLRHLELRPCRNAPAYLLGLMVAVPEGEMPSKLQGKSIIAAEPDNQRSSFVSGANNGVLGPPRNDRSYLYIDRRWSPHRLHLVSVNPDWPLLSMAEAEKGVCWDTNWAFLAEKM